MSRRLNPFEKETLIRIYRENPNVGMKEFCKSNGITTQAFKKWMAQYNEAGIEGLVKGGNLPDILPSGMSHTEENYKKEILRLTIENERLKKNYVVRQNPNGKIQMQLLDTKSLK